MQDAFLDRTEYHGNWFDETVVSVKNAIATTRL